MIILRKNYKSCYNIATIFYNETLKYRPTNYMAYNNRQRFRQTDHEASDCAWQTFVSLNILTGLFSEGLVE